MRRFRRNLALVCGLLLASWCHGALSQRYLFHTYGQSEGLGNVAVSRIAFDRDGFLWIATENGLYRLLGARMERYGIEQGLRERAIRDVFVDPAGRVWVASYENLYRWNGRGFEPFDKTPTPIWGPGRIAARDSRHLVLIRQRELVEFTLDAAGKPVGEKQLHSSEQRKRWPEIAAPTSLALAPDGTVWMGCEYKICSTRDGNVKVWGPAEGVPKLAEKQDFWRSLLWASNGSLWAVSARDVVELAPGAAAFTNRRVPGVELSGNTGVSPILQDRRGGILRATDAGVARWDGSSWQRIEKKNGLPDGGPATSLAEDGNGDLWIGSASSGLWQWSGYGNLEGWTAKEGLPDDSIWSFDWPDSDHVLIGTEKGPARLELDTYRITPLFTGSSWSHGQVSGLLDDKRGHIWASTWSGKLLRIDPASRRATQAGNIQWLSYTSVLRPDSGILFLSRQGIYVVDRPDLPSVPHPVAEVDALLGGKKAVMAQCRAANGDLWFLAENGVLRLRATHWSLAKISGFAFQGTVMAGIGCSPDGTVWIDGQDAKQEPGIWHLKPAGGVPDGTSLVAERVPPSAVMHDVEAQSLLVDRRGWLWIGTDVGVAVWNGVEWRHFTQQNGLIWNDSNQAVLREAPDGTIWIGTSGGAAHVLHPESVFEPAPLPVAITSVWHNNWFFLPGEPIALPWSRAPVRFDFASGAGWNRGALEFHYRIAGWNPGWIVTREQEASLPSLPPGKYRFEVFARNPESGVSSPVAGVAFQILAPWWLQWWSLGICLGVIAGVLWLLLWLRTRQLVAGQHKLEALVLERTRELEASREALRMQATHDALTGLFNRRAILELLNQETERARREGTFLVVLLADIDHFKRVNDTHGHLAGDEVLRRFAQELNNSVRTYDHAGRYGGEEFLMVVGNLPAEGIKERLAHIHASLTNLAVQFEGREIRTTCSIGASFVSPSGALLDQSQLLSTADKALYAAKHSGRNCLVLAGLSGTEDGSERTVRTDSGTASTDAYMTRVF